MTARSWIILGVLSIVGAFTIMVGSIVFAENEQVRAFYAGAFCKSDESMYVTWDAWSLRNGESGEGLTYFCLGEDNDARNVTLWMFSFLTIIFLGSILAGFFFIIKGISLRRDAEATVWERRFVQGISSETVTDEWEIPTETRPSKNDK